MEVRRPNGQPGSEREEVGGLKEDHRGNLR